MLDHAQALRPTALQVDLARRIAREILAGAHVAGTHLSEELLARQYQVSRTPVRAALKLLATQDLISYRQNSGYFVCELAENAQAPEWQSQGLTSDELYRVMIEDRANRQLPDSLTDRDLLQRYAVTRSVLAKTLVRLSAEALIEKRKGHGWRFPNSLEDAQARAESFRFRSAVECAGLLESDFRADPAALARMRASHQALAEESDPEAMAQGFFALNAEFHEMLARFSGNRFVLQTVQQQNQLRRLATHGTRVQAPRYAASIQEHLQIIQAVTDNELEWAAALMRQHLRLDYKATGE
ncbi:GntR family transcriptional regulator [Bordetella genomosp. 10]|uniref:GntR family transcriptional regulator n=1 Tax=Bordetella genomosp. 10 TaxID=1416804 RepID=A0A261RZQ0_9BORD|nr:GntR family transcriptional regulator [Bordetella genomosp. 10]OZI30395.1 GntR family transcriptional regulator [Bordetella genomosp. 10]